MSKKTKTRVLANPVTLAPIDDDDFLVVIIETPKGSRNKYAFNPGERIFELKTVLPSGMAFPYDFGFVPSTLGGDGDPLDALVLMDEPAFPGCKLSCRIIGIIEGEQVEGKQKQRNDRIVTIGVDNHSFAQVSHINDLGKQFQHELEEFFVNYHRLSKREFRILDVKGPSGAKRAIDKARRQVK